MTDKPDFVLRFERPPKTEIKKIGNHWYLYERSSRYDPALGRSRKMSGACLGKITEEGLVPTRRRQVPSASSSGGTLEDVVEAGATVYAWRRTVDVRERLRRHFGDDWRGIYAAALLLMRRDPSFRRLEAHFETSLLSAIFPRVSFSSLEMGVLLRDLGRGRAAIRQFMMEDVESEGRFILWADGADPLRVFFWAAGEKGIRPVYYKAYPGTTPDVSAFLDLLEEAGVGSGRAVVIGGTETDWELLDACGLRFIAPLQCPLLTGQPSETFTHGRRILEAFRASEDSFSVFVYRDAGSENPETEECFALRTNERALDGEAVFRLFAQRCSAGGPADEEADEGRLFLRHLAGMMTAACMDASQESWEDLGTALESVRACRVGGRWQAASVGKWAQECLSRAGFSLSSDEVEALVREGGSG